LQKKRQLSSALLRGMAIVLMFIAIVTSITFLQEVKGSLSLDNSYKKQPLKHFIQVCCTWGHKLTNGTLTYKIIGADAVAQQAVKNAINKWNTKLKDIRITETSTKSHPDIEVNFNPTAQKIDGNNGAETTSAGHTLRNSVTAGQSVNNFDENGFITSVRISISRSAFGNTLSLNKIEQLTEHEIGHALGVGHANFNSDLMSVVVSGKSGSVSKCDINAIMEANQWKLIESSNIPHGPVVDHVNC
jgi:predicted Zn-dependent protease